MELVSAAPIVCCGEGMLELAQAGEGWKLGYGGDTLNTAIHLARAGHHVAYLTALGPDPFSLRLRREWAAEGLDVAMVLTHPRRSAGIYAITTDAHGERTFTYWRDTSAAREMFELEGFSAAAAAVARAELLFFSLITLAILRPVHRDLLLRLAERVRANGGKVAFDGNYRPGLWRSPGEARAAHERASAITDIGLPTLDDERLLWGAQDAAAAAERWRAAGCLETVLKLGAEGCLLPDGKIVPPERRLEPVDTSGAGDAFNAGYLSARLRGAEPPAAALAGHRLAAWTIMRPGAIPATEGQANLA